MNDLFENKLTSLIFDLLKGWDINFGGHVMPTVINDVISKNFWRYFFNFDFFIFFERFNTPYTYKCNLNITTN